MTTRDKVNTLCFQLEYGLHHSDDPEAKFDAITACSVICKEYKEARRLLELSREHTVYQNLDALEVLSDMIKEFLK